MSKYVLEVGSPLVDQFYLLYPETSLDAITLSHIFWIPEQPSEPPTEYGLINCRRKKVRMSGERQLDDLMSDHFTTFQVPRDTLAVDGNNSPIPPVPADWIIHTRDGQTQRWNILSVTKQLIGACYNCDCERIL